VIADINATGYGLTFGLHSRIDDRVEHITSRLQVGNIYINRNQIGAVVASQPFGGEGLSGTGPKAGGPHYLSRFMRAKHGPANSASGHRRGPDGRAIAARPVEAGAICGVVHAGDARRDGRIEPSVDLRARRCPVPRSRPEVAEEQAKLAEAQGCVPLIVAPEASGADAIPFFLERGHLATLKGFDAVMLWSGEDDLRAARIALAKRDGPLVPLISEADPAERLILERHVCIDTTAAGGNAALLAANA
jgi:RHH-type proline utilization regulon transcriptional repressor/proline dehydrogenase/delta 1-pyrroline-5-carboxylate dehydrogenase